MQCKSGQTRANQGRIKTECLKESVDLLVSCASVSNLGFGGQISHVSGAVTLVRAPSRWPAPEWIGACLSGLESKSGREYEARHVNWLATSTGSLPGSRTPLPPPTVPRPFRFGDRQGSDAKPFWGPTLNSPTRRFGRPFCPWASQAAHPTTTGHSRPDARNETTKNSPFPSCLACAITSVIPPKPCL